jgi:hypothetical protein
MPIPLSQRLDPSVVDLADKYGPTAVGQDDPSQEIPGAPPNLGQSPLPHVLTFQGIASSIAKVYRPSDEAMKDSRENARFMRNDPTIMECLEMRRRSTALLNWHIEPEDEKDETAKWLAGELTDVLKKTPRFTQFRECLLDALWYGKYGVQMRYRWKTTRNGKRIVIDRWQPVNGDKLVFRYDDGSGDFDPDQVGIRVGTGFTGSDGVSQRWGDHRLSKVEATDWGMAYFLEPWERKLLAIHKHMIEDGEYEELQNAGRIHGVGIRSRIYWLWYQRQECLAWLMEFLERSAFGIEIWYYPWGSPKAREDTRKAAEERIGQGRNIILVPKPMGEDGMSYGVERIEPGMQGAEILKEILSDFFGHQIKRYILGQTLTTEAGSTGLGSNLASIHLDTYLQIIHYDAGNLDETMTEDVVQPLQLFNFPKYAHLAMRFKTATDAPDVESKLKAWREAFDMGCKLRERDVMDLIGADMPEEGEEALQNPQFKEQPGGMPGMPGMPGAGGMPGMPPGAGADGGMPPGMEGEGGGQAPGSFDDGSGGGGDNGNGAPPAPPPGTEDYDANGQPIYANSDRKLLLDPEKIAEPEPYKRKPGKGQMDLFGDDDDGPNDPEFEAKHPRGPDGEFVKKGGGSEEKSDKPQNKQESKPESAAKASESPKEPEATESAGDMESPLEALESADNPRDAADRLFEDDQEEQYKYARKSTVSNVGEDVTGSARHKANAWRSLEDAERDGTAEKLVTRDKLLKNEPHNFVTLADENPLSSMVMYLALRRFPPKPGYGTRKVGEEEAKKNREQYLEAYRSIKKRAEEIAANQDDPVAASKSLQRHVNDLINGLREGDRHNATANGLIGLLNQLGAYGMRKKNSPVYRMVEFAAAYRNRYGEESADKGKMVEHVKEVMDGKSFNATFGVESDSTGPQWKPSDRYVKHAERKGGASLDVGTPEKAHGYMTSTLGLRAVQYGNYVTDDERKHHATKAAEAFADLADAIGLPLEYVSWKGELGLAIGARGHGNASAHYEPGTKMMNLTRASGVGAVAHEWGHFFDNMLTGGGLRGGGTERLEGDYASEQTSPVRITKDADEAAMWGGEELPTSKHLSGDRRFWKIDKSKDPLWKAMSDVRQSWRDSGYVKRLSKAMRNLGLSDGRRKYFTEVKEVFARSFEKYVEHKLGERDQKNTYLTGLAPDVSEDTDLWPTATEIKEMAPAFDGLMKAFRDGIDKGRYAMRYSVERGPYLERYAKDAEFEKLHPRGEGGEFAEAGSTLSKPKESKPDAKPSNVQQAADSPGKGGLNIQQVVLSPGGYLQERKPGTSKPIEDAYDAIPDSVKRVAGSLRVDLDSREGGGAVYQFGAMRVNPDHPSTQIKSEFVHEFGHHLDLSGEEPLSDSPEFAEAFSAARKRASRSVPELPAMKSPVGHAMAAQMDQLNGALTGGKSPSPTGMAHGESYFSEVAGRDKKEAFSTAFNGWVLYNPKMQKAYPELFTFFDNKFGPVDGDAGPPDTPTLSSTPGQLFDTSEDPYESEFGTFARDPAKAAPKGKRGRKPMPGQRGLWEDFDVPEKPKRQEQQMLFRNEGERLRYMLDREMCQRGLGSPYTPEDEARLAAWFAGGQNGQVDIPDRFGNVYRYSGRGGGMSIERFARKPGKGQASFWDEDDHPRNEDGEFAKADSGTAKSGGGGEEKDGGSRGGDRSDDRPDDTPSEKSEKTENSAIDSIADNDIIEAEGARSPETKGAKEGGRTMATVKNLRRPYGVKLGASKLLSVYLTGKQKPSQMKRADEAYEAALKSPAVAAARQVAMEAKTTLDATPFLTDARIDARAAMDAAAKVVQDLAAKTVLDSDEPLALLVKPEQQGPKQASAIGKGDVLFAMGEQVVVIGAGQMFYTSDDGGKAYWQVVAVRRPTDTENGRIRELQKTDDIEAQRVMDSMMSR